MFYVYILKDYKTPFYVGKGTSNRMYQHRYYALHSTKNLPVLNKIRKMVKQKRCVVYEKVLITTNETLAFEEEVQLIAHYGRRDNNTGILLNLTDGGEGVRGYTYTEQHRKNKSLSMKRAIKEGRAIIPSGKFERDDQYRLKMSKVMKNVHARPEVKIKRQQITSSLKGKKRILTDEARNKMATGRGRIWTQEMRKRHSQSMKKAWDLRHKT